MATETASVAQLKTHLPRYLAKARAGQAIEVTSHRKPVARITGVPNQSAEGGLARLVAEGCVTWGGGAKPQGASIRLGEASKTLSDIVIEDRGPY